jgi:hypothetical protein
MKRLFLFCLLTGLLAPLAAKAQMVTISPGTLPSIFLPLNQFSAQGVYEAIYLQTLVNQGGTITRLAFEKNDGTDLRDLDGVSVYLKSTPATQFTTGTIDSSGYQRVFRGSFTNTTGSGFQEIVLQQPFVYNNTGNLSLLVIRRNGTAVAAASNGPRARWRYGTSTAAIARRFDGGTPITSSTTLATSNVLANLRLTFGAATASRLAASLRVELYPNPAGSRCRVQLPTGVYFLALSQGQQHSVQQLVKE